ncbi:hypothetical protein CLV59_101203 [Chitinophaga dinghuensis]|uniref:Uncharacterized protein n=1 Tax=Chitinophaga dinghuensis TaxID=1539050 RepID=A0A327WC71_9BACT|nr:hypothetical protein CLV59_101203 [Chitinophaga dinghuensis]
MGLPKTKNRVGEILTKIAVTMLNTILMAVIKFLNTVTGAL